MNNPNKLSTQDFRRYDEQADEQFYAAPRLVVHIDDQAIRALTTLLAKLLPPTGAYLDLMSSWRSHLPVELKPIRVVGLGMNAKEMAENPQLDSYLVQNLNTNPTLPFPDAEFDATVCTVSVQYMTKPVEIFREVNRVLKPGGIFVLSFSNRCFSTKAIATWLAGTDAEHVQLVEAYFIASGHWTKPETAGFTPKNSDPLYAVWGYKV
ncbi:MAG: class I SAM-dependent methyltransferase [Chloroflexi bacterium]|nr:class I SAM-dependent methyltransferase [Chloroflexota bacterium]